MRPDSGVRALCVAVAILACGTTSVFADPLTSSASLENTALKDVGWSSLSGAATSEQFLYFAGADLWRHGGSAYGGLYWAPDGLNSNGFTFKLLLAEGAYRYRSGARDIRGVNLLAAALPGWRFTLGSAEIRAFAGLDLQYHRLRPDDAKNRLRGANAGLRVGAEVWWEPLRLLMLSSSLSASTIGSSFGVRGAAGWRVSDLFWTGPEIEASGDDIYRQYRAGIHVTALKFAEFEWSASGGYVADNSRRSGAYGRFSFVRRQ